jgi:large subunit ribosomal protein L15
MKLHDLRPPEGAHKARTRVGRGIAAGKGKTAGRGTKGQKARAGGTIPAWFEGGQTPAHMRLPKLHGFRRPWRIDYQVVNVGRISEYAAAGRFGSEPGSSPLTVNSELLRGAGLISTERQPVKVLGHGDVTVKLFVAAEAFTKSAREKIEAAGGFVQPLAVTAASTEVASETAETAERADTAGRAETAEKSGAKAPATRSTPAPETTTTSAAVPPVTEDPENGTEQAVTDEAADGSMEPVTAEASPVATAETSSEDVSEPATTRRRSRKSADSAGE